MTALLEVSTQKEENKMYCKVRHQVRWSLKIPSVGCYQGHSPVANNSVGLLIALLELSMQEEENKMECKVGHKVRWSLKIPSVGRHTKDVVLWQMILLDCCEMLLISGQPNFSFMKNLAVLAVNISAGQRLWVSPGVLLTCCSPHNHEAMALSHSFPCLLYTSDAADES